VFDNNSLEQLLINYANEKLQQQFNEQLFNSEQQEYIKEGIKWNKVEYNDRGISFSLTQLKSIQFYSFLFSSINLNKIEIIQFYCFFLFVVCLNLSKKL
jgi:uncharacterized protein YkuJ